MINTNTITVTDEKVPFFENNANEKVKAISAPKIENGRGEGDKSSAGYGAVSYLFVLISEILAADRALGSADGKERVTSNARK